MNLFKKTLLATAVMAVSGGAMAVDTTVTTLNLASKQSFELGLIKNNGIDANLKHSVASFKPSNLTAGADDLAIGTIIKFTLANGAKFAESAYYLGDAGCVDSDAFATAVGAVSSDYSTVSFETTAAITESTSFELCVTNGLRAQQVVLGSTDIGATAITAQAFKSNVGILTEINKPTDGSNVKNVIEVRDQYTFEFANAASKFDAQIDVAQERKAFVNATSDTMAITISDNINTGEEWLTAGTFTPSAAVFTVSGDFSAFDGEGQNGTTSATGGTLAIADDFQSLTITAGAAVSGDYASTVTLTTGDEQAVISPSSYEVDVELTQGTGTTAKSLAYGPIDAGSLTLNGAGKAFNYVPYGDNLEQFIWITNKGKVTGDISVVATLEDGTVVDLGVVSQAEAGLTKIDADIAEALAAEGFTSGRAALEIVVNSPTGDIDFYGAYKVKSADDRLGLNPSTL
jgi:hypothetical protein